MITGEIARDRKPHLFVVANLEHASPRIPGLVCPLAKLGWKITVLTPKLMSNADIELGLPDGFQDHVHILETRRYSDVYELPRKLMRFLKIARKGAERGYTEALKSKETGKSSQNNLIDRLLVYYQAIFAYPDTEKAWYKSAVNVSCKYLKSYPETIVLSSSPYPVCHLIAKRICAKLDLKWVADFRDPWSQSHNYTMPRWRKLIDQITEVNALKTANLILTVSDGSAVKLRQLHRAPVHVVRNGYQTGYQYTGARKCSNRIKIAYTGSIYPDHQSILPVLDALVIVRDQNIDISQEIELTLYGVNLTNINKEIAERCLEGVVSQKDRLPRSDIRRIQQQSDILLFLNWETPGDHGIFPLKFFEYLDARRPILATGRSPDDGVTNILKKTEAGVSITSAPEIAKYLVNALISFKNSGKVEYHGLEDEILEYSFDNSSTKLAMILQTILPATDGKNSRAGNDR